MAFPINVTRNRTDLGTGWDARIDEVATAAAAVSIRQTTVQFNFSFGDFGGAQTTHNLGALPNGAVITSLWYDVGDEFTSGGAAEIRIGISGDAPDAVALANLATNGGAGPHGSTIGRPALDGNARAAGFVGDMVKLSDNRQLEFEVDVADLTAGDCAIYVTLFLNDE